jgi:hypothetical protein
MRPKTFLLAAAVVTLLGVPAKADFITLAPTSAAILFTGPFLPVTEIFGPLGGNGRGFVLSLGDLNGRFHYEEVASIYDLSSLATVRSATITVHITAAQSDRFSSPASLTMASFNPAGAVVTMADFHAPASFVGTTGALPQQFGTDVPFTFDITPLIHSLVGSGKHFTGFQYYANSTVFGVVGDLVVDGTLATAVPEPSALVLAAFGGAICCGFGACRALPVGGKSTPQRPKAS